MEKLSKNYYEVDEINPKLNDIFHNLDDIKKEVELVKGEIWQEWPEKHLHSTKTICKWNIFPFKAFGTIIDENCNKCPKLWQFIQSIPEIKCASLSKLGPGSKLVFHQGWGSHSNYVIRCHFGFDVPDGCYLCMRETVKCSDDIRLQKQDSWICFDDSRHHYAHNPTEKDRIVLIVDVDRPETIKIGESEIEDSDELLQIIEYFKTK